MAAEFGLEIDVFTLEVEFFDALHEGLSDLLELLGNDRQHLNKNTVELIEASPAALHGKATEMTLHHLIIDLIGAVVHDTEDGESLSQIFCRLGLAGTGGASGVGTELDVKGTCDSDPALVGKRRDDQTSGSAQVFVAIKELGLHLANHAEIFLCATTCGLDILIGITELLLPVEVIRGLNSCGLQILNDGLRVHILRDEGRQLQALKVSEVATDHISQHL